MFFDHDKRQLPLLIQSFKKDNLSNIMKRKEKNDKEENLAFKKNNDWWRLEKFQIGTKNFP